jgi:hypothetical protein
VSTHNQQAGNTLSPSFTPPEIAHRLNRSWLTVYNWLRGTATLPPMPYYIEHYGEKAIRYKIDEPELVDWLALNQPKLRDIWVSKSHGSA